MKPTKQTPTKWYLFTDGKSAKVINDINKVSTLRGVIVEITADQAATILALMVERTYESEV